jgi:hypothetical protein
MSYQNIFSNKKKRHSPKSITERSHVLGSSLYFRLTVHNRSIEFPEHHTVITLLASQNHNSQNHITKDLILKNHFGQSQPRSLMKEIKILSIQTKFYIIIPQRVSRYQKNLIHKFVLNFCRI